LALAFIFILFSGLAQAQNSGLASNPPEAVAQPDQKIEVVYFFYYANFDCQVLESKLANFERSLPKNVKFEVLPVVVLRGTVGEDEYYQVNQYADLFFVLDYFGQEKILRKQIYQTIMDTLVNTGEFALVDMEYQMDFLNEYSLTVKEYREAMESERVDAKIEKALDFIYRFNINTVPAFVINGKTLILYDTKKGADNYLLTVRKAIEEAAAPPAPSPPKAKTVSKK
jgi:hypothetical protein